MDIEIVALETVREVGRVFKPVVEAVDLIPDAETLVPLFVRPGNG
jgi:hypothetical protein